MDRNDKLYTKEQKKMTNLSVFKEWTIEDIEKIDEVLAYIYANEKTEIKGHAVYFLDFGGYFGYSALVFCHGRQVRYANGYELHHKGHSREELRALYTESLKNKLFTEQELAAAIKSVDELRAKKYFLQNYYGMREPHVSAFRISKGAADDADFEKKTRELIFNPVCFCYHESADFVKKCIALRDALQRAERDFMNDFDNLKNMFLYEMFNHEYGINWQADYDVLSAFGNVDGVDYTDTDAMMAALDFTDTQRRAYAAARTEYFRKTKEV